MSTAAFIATVVFSTVLIAHGQDGYSDLTEQQQATVKNLLNKCIDSKFHKYQPGPEDSLHRQCSPWANRSCCTHQTTYDAHYTNIYNLNYDHCSHIKRMSEKCRRHFIQDLCFYECSPNVGPWSVSVEQKIRKERFVKVPLCSSDCSAWFNDCVDDYTCVDNWSRKFVWVEGSNRCPSGSSCKKFIEVFNDDSKYFCENVFDHSWKVTDDDNSCMRIWFDSKKGNPNDLVAIRKAVTLAQAGFSTSSSHPFFPSNECIWLFGAYLVFNIFN